MPPEKVLNLPLSGEEVRNAILDKLSRKLEKDCFLSPNTAYDWFTANIDISIHLHDVARDATVQAEVLHTAGEIPEGVEIRSVNDNFEIGIAPPNEIRVETGQPVPVLTQKEGKQEIKGVRYARNKIKR
jgi:hypothetical protein